MLWWNVVGRTGEEIRQACGDWMSGDRFGEVKGATTATGSMPQGH
ncbi:pirin [Streptomyces vietnamensis]